MRENEIDDEGPPGLNNPWRLHDPKVGDGVRHAASRTNHRVATSSTILPIVERPESVRLTIAMDAHSGAVIGTAVTSSPGHRFGNG